MAYLQERVIAYVTMDPCLFVAEERLLIYGPDKNKDYWYVDVLIVDPWNKLFYLGEVTYDQRPNRLIKKLEILHSRKVDVLRGIGRDGAPHGWDVRPWLFLRKDAVDYVKQRLPADLHPRLTHLEATASPWEYEKLRMEGKELDGHFED